MDQHLCLFVGGDVMTGRGIDQVLSHPDAPRLYEPYVHDARDYLRLAEAAHGPFRHPVADDYIWGEALKELGAADARIVNLETSVTTSGDYWPGKEVHCRTNPQNIGCLTAAGLDCCVLANSHVLDWGYEIPDAQIHFAYHLIEEGVDLVHGHSSHHFKALEVYRGRPILYGCGDLLTDYEGIRAMKSTEATWASCTSSGWIRRPGD